MAVLCKRGNDIDSPIVPDYLRGEVEGVHVQGIDVAPQL